MTKHEITLSPSDLNDINTGAHITVMTDDGTEIVISSEAAWQGPARSPGVYRVGISDRQLAHLRYGRTVPVILSGGDVTLVFTIDAEVAAR